MNEHTLTSLWNPNACNACGGRGFIMGAKLGGGYEPDPKECAACKGAGQCAPKTAVSEADKRTEAKLRILMVASRWKRGECKRAELEQEIDRAFREIV